MNKISILPQSEVNKIAAGEVIERPSSVVKELIENSIDAEADFITIEIERGGEELIRVSDDGYGMSKEDALLSLERHATSKIQTSNDIVTLSTFGFRGEALPSIASVSYLELLTRREEDVVASLIKAEEGKITVVSEDSRAVGTTVSVFNLFYNTPVRRKFLRGVTSETRRIIDEVIAQSIGYPNIGFCLICNGRESLKLEIGQELKERLFTIYGRDEIETMIEINSIGPPIAVKGFVSSADNIRFSKRNQILYVNKRRITNRMLNHAIYKGYGENLGGKHPSYFIFLELDPTLYDVNVHPTKREVKFRDEGTVYRIVKEAIDNSFLVKREGNFRKYSNIFQLHNGTQINKESFDLKESVLFSRDFGPHYRVDEKIEDVEKSLDKKLKNVPIVLWQLHKTYIFASIKDGFLIIDQHVAHERILYEQILKGRGKGSQQLLFPPVIELSPVDYDIWNEFYREMESLGFSIKSFSGRSVVVESVPTLVPPLRVVEIVKEILNDLSTVKRTKERYFETISKIYACRAAIKAGDELTQEEMNQIVDELFATDVPHFCPHGRPIMVRISIEELHRRFGRI